MFALGHPFSVERASGSVDYAPQQCVTDFGPTSSAYGYHLCVGSDSSDLTDRHQQQPIAGKSNHLCIDAGSAGAPNHAAIADRGLAPDGFDSEANHSGELPFDHQGTRCLSAVNIGR